MARLWNTVVQMEDDVEAEYPKHNPLTKSGKKVMRSMIAEYGEKKGRSVIGKL